MLYRKRLTSIVLLLFTILAVMFLPGCGEGLNTLTNGRDNDFDWSDWSYKRSIIVTSADARSEYQINVILSTANFSFANADESGNDLRFNYNGTSLPYWIESWDEGDNASIWVKVPALMNGNTVIYLYYGNAGQNSTANFDNTFTKDSGFPGLAAQWHMDEGSGTSIYDSSANSNTGTITGATWVGADGRGWFTNPTAGFSTGDSLLFNGTSNYVTVTDNNSLDAASTTITSWIKTGLDVTTTQYVLAKWDEVTDQRSYAISIENSTIYFLTSETGTLATVDSLGRGTVLTNTWYHIAVTSDGSNKKIYLNGTQADTSSGWASTIHPGNSTLTIGSKDSSLIHLFKGIIDEVSIYDNALDGNQIKALSQRSKYSSTVSAPIVGIEEIVP